jgi:pimeloyl-ACP methyl ester carboxylesterase
MATFVLVPGAWHGGWYYRPIAQALRQGGHEAYPVTLAGVGDRAHLLAATANLDTHIQDVVSVLETEHITDAVLVGHSYAGMVITGVADRCPGRVGRLVYVDAYVPADGDSCWDVTTQSFRQSFIESATADGFRVAPRPGLDPRATAHPLPSLLQRLRLSGAPGRVRRRDFIYLSGWQESPFSGMYDRLSQDPNWHTHRLPTGHNIVAEAPDKLLEILLQGGGEAADDRQDRT